MFPDFSSYVSYTSYIFVVSSSMPLHPCVQVLEATRIPVDLDFMRQTLAEGHPIVFGLKLTQRFFNPRQGYCAKPDPNDPQSASHGLHAMLIVGYSWGTSWGDRGYGYLVALNAAVPMKVDCVLGEPAHFEYFPVALLACWGRHR